MQNQQERIRAELLQKRMESEYALIKADMDQKNELEDERYRALWLDAVMRRRQKKEGLEESSVDVSELMATQDTLFNELFSVTETISSDSVTPFVSFIQSALSMVLIPWKCYKEKRSPTPEEGLRLRILGVSIALGILAMTPFIGPAVAAAIVIALAALTVVQSLLGPRMAFKDLDRRLKKQKINEVRIEALFGLINQLQAKNPLSTQDENLLLQKRKELRECLDQYIEDGAAIRVARKKLASLQENASAAVSSASGLTFFIGTVFLFIPPLTPIGLGMMLASTAISIVTTAVKGIFSKKERAAAVHGITPERAKVLREEGCEPQTAKEREYARIIQEQQAMEATLKSRRRLPLASEAPTPAPSVPPPNLNGAKEADPANKP